ncbi:MAG: hypothetical protein ACLFVR_01540 [Thiohalospira sp.]
MEEENLYKKLKEFFNELVGDFSILEEQVDVNMQVEFFELIDELNENKRNADIVLKEKEKVFDPELAFDKKKRLLAELSNIDQPEAYRIIEKVVDSADNELYKWAVLALQHCRVSLETSLLDEGQVFISTGLGGEGKKLRYFFACMHKNEEDFTDAQKRIFQTEFEDIFVKYKCKIENITFTEKYVTVLTLIPIDVSTGEVIKSAMDECNQYGDFLYHEYLITNVKALNLEEINKFFKD